MNKKKKQPTFIDPFAGKKEESLGGLSFVRMNFVSERGSKVSLVETSYPGAYRKLELKEIIYIKKGETRKYGDIFYLRPHDQVRMKKLLNFVAHIDKDDNLFLTRKEYSTKSLKFTSDQWRLIRLFYERRSVTLEDAVRILGTYKNAASLRQTIIKINRRIVGWFRLSSKDEFIKGNFYKNRDGYSFNPNIRLEFLEEQGIAH